MNEDQQAAFEAWVIGMYSLRRDGSGEYSSKATHSAWMAWQAALESPEVQAVRDALRNLYQAIDSCVELTPEVMRQAQAALAAMEKQK
jgi:hypothetical protein